MRPALIVTIDTEEEGLWSGNYHAVSNTVENTRGIPRFQALCDRHGIRPTYLIDSPVVDDDRSADLLRSIQDDGRSEVGAHLHPWCTPPLDERVRAGDSFLSNLPESTQRAKLQRLTEDIERRIGRRPRSFRAGRYGLNMSAARILSELGYRVDSSVIPFSDFSDESGPDFRRAPYLPYVLQGDELNEPHRSGCLLEVPVSVGYNWTRFRNADRIRQFVTRAPMCYLHIEGVLDRLGALRRIKFSPEQADAAQMSRLVDCFLAQGASCLVMLFHSSSLVPGFSPYVPDSQALEEFYVRLESTFDFCLSQRGMTAMTLSDFAGSCTRTNSHGIVELAANGISRC